jgi:hypothetical protein
MSYTLRANPPTIREVPGRKYYGEEPVRNVRRQNGKDLRRRLDEKLTVLEVTQAVAATLNNVAAKEIAYATGGSIRAAQNVREGLNAMSLTGFINACRAIPELRALAMDMMGCEAETDPEFVRGIALLMNSYSRRQLGREAEMTGISECRSPGSAPTT